MKPRNLTGIASTSKKAGYITALCLTLTMAASAPASTRNSSAASANEAAFLKDNDTAMGNMMTGIASKPMGDVDRDFVNRMVPHHQGAIDMAMAVLRYGHNEQIRRLAQEIVVDQQQEMAAMRRAVGEAPAPSVPAPIALSRGVPATLGTDRGSR